VFKVVLFFVRTLEPVLVSVANAMVPNLDNRLLLLLPVRKVVTVSAR
jgi:hypothetical protein